MDKLIFILAVAGFILAFFKIEVWLIHKSRENFRNLKEAYKELKESKEDLHNLLKDKEL